MLSILSAAPGTDPVVETGTIWGASSKKQKNVSYVIFSNPKVY